MEDRDQIAYCSNIPSENPGPLPNTRCNYGPRAQLLKRASERKPPAFESEGQPKAVVEGSVPLRRNVRRYAICLLRGAAAQQVLPGAKAEGRSIPEEGHRP